MAAADVLRRHVRQQAGHRLPPGVDHAHRVAAAMRAVGPEAAAVSGRTPPRELANTLAAYERGEINVLVNAQLLAEGWNAPRATVCMHLAPTASKRVYQQRVGRIMRLHRRKEAGVVVDFAEPTAPHTDRTVTIHSLLGVDTYHPGALVTPRSPRRRQRWRRLAKPLVREAGWCVPVTVDPPRAARSSCTTGSRSRSTACPRTSRTCGRRTPAGGRPKDLPKLARVLRAFASETRMLFFATCAAENKNRALRLMALGDLAQNRPPANVFDRAVRLVEAAPTWRLDRAQGARTLLLALGDRRVEASDHQVVAWAWRLARASRDAQFRRVAAALDNGRDLARSLSGKSGDAVCRAATVTSRAALDAPLDVGAALLATSSPTTSARCGSSTPPAPGSPPTRRSSPPPSARTSRCRARRVVRSPRNGRPSAPRARRRSSRPSRTRRPRNGGARAGGGGRAEEAQAPAPPPSRWRPGRRCGTCRQRRRAGRRVAAAGAGAGRAAGSCRRPSEAHAPAEAGTGGRGGRTAGGARQRGRRRGQAEAHAAPEGGRARGIRRRRGRAVAARRVRGRGGACQAAAPAAAEGRARRADATTGSCSTWMGRSTWAMAPSPARPRRSRRCGSAVSGWRS